MDRIVNGNKPHEKTHLRRGSYGQLYGSIKIYDITDDLRDDES